MRKNDYRAGLRKKIEGLPGEVFKRGDITTDLSKAVQLRLSRALKALIAEGTIMKIGHGLYAKAHIVKFKQESYTLLKKSFAVVAMEALDKLGVAYVYGEAIQAYNRGDTQQVPIHFVVRLKSRFRGYLKNGERLLEFEGGINAR